MCTLIQVKALDGSIIVGRNEDLGTTTPLPNLSFIPKGFHHKAALPEKDNPLEWTTKYAYCGADFGGYPCYIYEGVNEHDMAVSSLYLPQYTDYRTDLPAKNPNYLSSLELAPWVLGNFKDIPEFLTKGLPKLRKGKILIKSNGALSFPHNPQHLGIIDKTGRFIVLEFADVNGALTVKEYPQVYENPVGVLTNAPPFEWHLINISNYVNVQALTPDDVRINGRTFRPASGAAGTLGLPGDFMPASRFIRMVFLLNNAPTPRNAEEAITLAFQLLGNVSVPDGASISPAGYDPYIHRTIFTAVKDITHHKFYWRTYTNPNIAVVSYKDIFKEMRKNGSKKVKAIPLGTKKIPRYIDLTKDVKNLSFAVNEYNQVEEFSKIFEDGKPKGDGWKVNQCAMCPTPGYPNDYKKLFGIPIKK